MCTKAQFAQSNTLTNRLSAVNINNESGQEACQSAVSLWQADANDPTTEDRHAAPAAHVPDTNAPKALKPFITLTFTSPLSWRPRHPQRGCQPSGLVEFQVERTHASGRSVHRMDMYAYGLSRHVINGFHGSIADC